MPSLLDRALDERFDELAAQLRAAKPLAADELRERVRALRPVEPEPRWRRAWSRRATLVLAAAALVAFAAAGIRGVVAGDEPGRGDQAVSAEASRPGVQSLEAQEPGAVPPPAQDRLQDYRAELRVGVEDLSDATAQAMRTTRSLGGYVVQADLADPESYLLVRVPVDRVEDAIARFTALGELEAQSFRIEDVQQEVNQRQSRIAALRRQLVELEERGAPTAEVRAELAREQRALDAQVREARLARIDLTLTGYDEAPAPPGEIESAVRDGLGALDDMVAGTLYALIVAAPFLALAAVGVAAERRRRRRSDERLLERAVP